MFCMIAVLLQTGCGREKEVSDTGFYLDTSCTITIYDIEKDRGEKLIKRSFSLCRKYEDLMSKTVKGSDIYRINHAEGEPVEVSSATLRVIKEGIKMGQVSDGRFDITVGRLTDLWDFDSDDPSVPDQPDIDAALKTIDYKQISIKGNKVSLEDPEAEIDLGGIAKGYIADRITGMLTDAGVKQAIINLGGNVAAIGEKSAGTPWKIGVETPYSNRTKIEGYVEAADQTVVTSGIYERYFKVKGKKYHHILDPDTGYPVENDVLAVTVTGKAGSSMKCDGYSTVCLLLGTDRGRKLIEKTPGLEAMFIDKDKDISKTKGMNFKK